MKYRVSAREWSVQIEESPPVTGTTSGLNEATVQPERMTLTEYGSGTVVAVAEGPKIRLDGTPGQSWAKVKVTVSGNDGGWSVRYPMAPTWVRDVYREVQ